MQRIYDRLLQGVLGPDYDRSQYEVQFRMSADRSPNAAIAAWEQPPLIFYTRGLVELTDNESELAAVLAHELTHGELHKRLGSHMNGKLEELASDLRAPYMLRMAGYPQGAMSTILRKLGSTELANQVFPDPFDVHPSFEVRLAALEIAERALVRGPLGMGEQDSADIDDPPISPSLRTTIGAISYQSVVERTLHEAGFARMEPPQQLDLLARLIGEKLLSWDTGLSVRGNDLLHALKGVQLSPQEPAHQAAIHRLVEVMTHTPASGWNPFITEKLYPALCQLCGYRDSRGKDALGGLAELQRVITQFVMAYTPEAIRIAAEDLNRIAGSYTFVARRDDQPHRIHPQDEVEFVGFSMPSAAKVGAATTPLAPSWDRQVRTALEDGQGAVLQALRLLGIINDPRLATFPQDATSHVLIRLSNEVDGRRLIYDKNGQIRDLRGLNELLRVEEERALFAKRSREERTLLPSVDWGLLEYMPYRFVEQYEEQLSVVVGVLDGEYPFAGEVANQMRALRARAPEAADKAARALDMHLKSSAFQQLEERQSWMEGSFTVGFSASHPLVGYLLEYPSGLDRSGGLDLLQYVRCLSDDKSQTPVERWQIDTSLLKLGLPAASVKEFRRTLGDLNPYRLKRAKVFPTILQVEAYRLLSQPGRAPLTIEELSLFRDIASGEEVEVLDYALVRALRFLVNGEVSKLRQRDVSRLGTEALIGEFHVLSTERAGLSLFSQVPELRVRYQNEIKRRIEAIEDPQSRQQLLRRLLSRQTTPPHGNSLDRAISAVRGFETQSPRYSGTPADLDFRSWACDRYAKTFPALLGRDDGSDTYVEGFKAQVEALVEKAPSIVTLDILSRVSAPEIGNQLLFQAPTARYVRTTMENQGLTEMVNQNLKAAVGEVLLKTLEKSASAKKGMVDFLLEPLTDQSAAEHLKKLEQAFKGFTNINKIPFLSADLDKEARLEALMMLHRNFWSLPFAGRVLASKLLLFGTRSLGDTERREQIELQAEQILDRMIPAEQKYGKESRLLIRSYLDATHNLVDREVLLAAMLVASHPEGNGSKSLGVGEALGLVLDALGPAGRKLKQGLESSSQLPEDLKAPLRSSKTMAVEVWRDQLFSWNAERGGGEEWIGRVLGAGSYAVTFEVDSAEHGLVARSMLYPHVRNQAEGEFEILTGTAANVASKDKRFASMADMVRQGSRASKHETDMGRVARQAEVARALYEGMEIEIEGHRYRFTIPRYLGGGTDYKDFAIAPGTHFNDLPAETGPQQAERRRLAMACLAMELQILLAGRPFDHDRHGGQQKIQGNEIAQFDFGALSLTAMSDRQKQLLGFVIGGLLRGHFGQRRPFDTVLEREIRRCAANIDEADFLGEVKRAMLALGNFRDALESDDLLKIIGSIHAAGGIDPVILQALEQQAGGLVFKRLMAQLEEGGRGGQIALPDNDRSFAPSADTSPLGELPHTNLIEQIPLPPAMMLGIAAGLATALPGFAWLYSLMKDLLTEDEEDELPDVLGLEKRRTAQALTAGALAVLGTVTVADAARGAHGLEKVAQALKPPFRAA